MPENKFLDDIAKFSNSTLSAMGSMQKQVRKWVSEQVEILIQNMDLVTKKDQQILLAKVELLEKRLQQLESGTPAKGKPAAKSKTKIE